MTSPARHKCISCAAPLSAGESLGLCAACAFRAALGMDDDFAEALPKGVLRRMGDYDLLEEAGRGGMGVVYRARQRSLDRIVALKVLLGGYFAGEEGRRRFRREAAAAARLKHPAIVAIHEAGEVDGQPFYSMEFIEGPTLAELLQRGPMPFRRAAALTGKIADALQCAHSQDVLHRDLKPSNVLMDISGEPHVTDFGLAKILTDSRPREEGVTLTNQVVGSPAWMAPEAAAAKNTPLTAKVDVYGAGAVLYEMLTGRPPFHGETPQEVLELVQHADPVPPRRLNASVPADLETVCLKCLEKEPRRRYASAAVLAEELQRFLSGERVLASPPGSAGRLWRWARRHRAQAAAAAVVIVALAAVGTVLAVTSVRVSRAREMAEARAEESRRHLVSSHVMAGTNFLNTGDTQRALPFFLEAQMKDGELKPGSANSARLATAVQHSPQPVKMWRAGGLIQSLRFSSDGKRIVCADGTAQVRLWSADPADRAEVTLPHPAPVFFAGFNGDGSRLLTADESTAYLWDAGKHERIGPGIPHAGGLTTTDQKRPPLFYASGAFFLTCEGKTLQRWSATDGTPAGAPMNAGARVTAHCFLPGGSKVLAATIKSEVMVFDAASGIRLSVIKLPEAARTLSVDEKGERAASICGQYRVVIFHLTSPDQPQIQGWHDPGSYAYQADFLPGGGQVLSSSYDGTVRLWDSGDGHLIGSLLHPGGVARVEHSGKGRRAVSVCWDGGVRVFSLPGFRPLCGPMMHTGPASAADIDSTGAMIVSGGCDDTVRLWRVPIHAPIHTKGLLQPDEWDPGLAAASWKSNGTVTVIDPASGRLLSPLIFHGSRIERVSLSSKAGRLAVLDKSGAAIWDTKSAAQIRRIPFTHGAVEHMHLTADGERLLLVSGSSLFIHQLSGGGKVEALSVKLTTPVHALAPSPDGRQVATVEGDSKVRVRSAEDGSLRCEPFGEEYGVHSVTWSPSGDRLAVASGAPGTYSTLRRTLRIFDPARGTALTPPMIHNDDIGAVAFSPDGRWIATGCEDMQARIFDAARGTLCCAPMTHDRFVQAVAFNAAGTLLAVASSDATTRLWEVPTGRAAGHPIITASTARQLFFSGDGRTLTGLFGQPDKSVLRTARLEIAPPAGMPLREFLTAVSCFRLTGAGNLEPVPALELESMWQRLHPAAAENDE